ncbi:hypothetical protein K457DRAFT_21402 [Linnemannia elongata AG-77]|uniref:Heparan-alpha-glucosaminide N-acetyltransferase catalytic domain-containing protein n=1 Tax=Linnemannia elongata AG-77 TaxID=1314771 RepID=A0A197JQE6_9FUNG|nr:hypothetical protein K457DRAFT_21402 [Linnemannia elongata AG-77]
MMQGDLHDESAPHGTTTTASGLSPPIPYPTTPTNTTLTPTNTFSSTSSSSPAFSTSGRTHYTHPLLNQQGLHRRRGSAASDHSTSTSPSSPKQPPSRHVDGLTFNPDHLSRQQQQQQQQQHQGLYQSVVVGGSGGNSNNDTSHVHALHPNITHHPSSNYSNTSKISGPDFKESTVTTTTAPSNIHTKDNYNNSESRLRDTLQPNHNHLQLQEYSDHPHAQTADSLASLGGVSGGGVGVGEGGVNNDDDDEDAEFEVRVIANRANVFKDGNDDDSHHRIQVLHNNEHIPPSSIAACTTTASTTPQQQGTGARTGGGGGGGGEAGKPKRLQSLDILRGITIIFMVLVNTQGADPFDQLAHTPWFGYTLADWVFPNFIFMVGMAVAIVLSPTKLVALSRSSDNHLLQLQQSGVKGMWRRHETRIWMLLKILKRSCILFVIGLGLNGLEMIGTEASWIRIPGVLQRIGFCYLVLALSVLWSPVRTLPILDSSTAGNANQAQAKRGRAQSPSPSSSSSPSSAPPNPSRRNNTTQAPILTKLTSSRRVKILLPVLCTTLWFILTYTIQSSATQPIPTCLYPSVATPTSSSSTNSSFSSETIILPGYAPSRGQLTPAECTAQSVLDTWLFTKDRDPNNPIFDAEGTLGTLMAVVTAWVGWMVGGLVVEQQRMWKGVLKGVVEDFERETEAEKVVERETTGGRRRREIVDESPKDTSESSSFSQHQQQSSPQAMETIPLPPSPPAPQPTKQGTLQRRITTHQRTHLLSHLGEWFMLGICTMFSGTILGWFLPICKSLWTPSFTLYSAGISINTLCILMYLYDVPSLPSSFSPSPLSTSPTKQPSSTTTTTTTPSTIKHHLHTTLITQTTRRLLTITSTFTTNLLISYGRNPTLIYILSELFKIILEKIPAHGGFPWVQTVWSWLFFNSFYRFLPPAWASLVFSLCYVLLFGPGLWYLDRKGVYLRV